MKLHMHLYVCLLSPIPGHSSYGHSGTSQDSIICGWIFRVFQLLNSIRLVEYLTGRHAVEITDHDILV